MKEELGVKNLTLILTTESNLENAYNLSNELLNKKLVACVSFNKINSLFWWETKITRSEEVQLIIKTKKSNLYDTLNMIYKLHSYDTPEILHLSVESNEEYVKWIEKVVK